MNAENVLAFLHVLSAFWYATGLAGVLLPLGRAWRSRDPQVQAWALAEASQYQGLLLLPGTIALGASGVFLWAEIGYNFLTTGWLLALEILYLVVLLLCLPLLGIGLRRAHLLSLQAAKHGTITPELEEALADKVPLVFGGIAVMLLPVMTYLALFKPL
ncbi:MAG TPA: DUF2269 family protein [Dehalococcoidia bacterium]|nr:DUF2269 family protein [Dehalococcoidia bacterium]